MSLRSRRLAIAGLGLIGGSLAARLKGSVREVVGWDRDLRITGEALEMGFITKAAYSPRELMKDTDLLVLAVPLRSMTTVSGELLPFAGRDLRAVLDVGSTKSRIGEDLASLWGERYVGLHPMAGKERSGLANAEAELFEGACCAVVPRPGSSAGARTLAVEVATALGARPLPVPPGEHDAATACVSHLPMLIAAALSIVACERGEEVPSLAALAGGGFASTSRVASGPSWLASDVWATNRRAITSVLDRFTEVLREMRESSPDELESMAEAGRIARDKLIEERRRSL